MESINIMYFIAGFGSALAINNITHVFTKIRDKKNNFLRIANELRKPFIEAKCIFDLSTRGLNETADIKGTFISLYTDQRRNINTIFTYIPSRQKSRLQAAWEKYEKQINSDIPSSWFDRENIYKENDGIKEKRQNLTYQLDHILFFFDYHNMFSVFKMWERMKQ